MTLNRDTYRVQSIHKSTNPSSAILENHFTRLIDVIMSVMLLSYI